MTFGGMVSHVIIRRCGSGRGYGGLLQYLGIFGPGMWAYLLCNR